MHFKRFFFAYALTFLIILFAATSFFRFIYLKDFIVSYESGCNPDYFSCYIGCMDDECSETYPYKYISKHATDIINRCELNNIDNCEAAQQCLEDDKTCEMSYCDPMAEDCYSVITNNEI